MYWSTFELDFIFTSFVQKEIENLAKGFTYRVPFFMQFTAYITHAVCMHCRICNIGSCKMQQACQHTDCLDQTYFFTEHNIVKMLTTLTLKKMKVVLTIKTLNIKLTISRSAFKSAEKNTMICADVSTRLHQSSSGPSVFVRALMKTTAI